MVKKRIVIFSLVLLCSSVVSASTDNVSTVDANLSTAETEAALQALQDGAKKEAAILTALNKDASSPSADEIAFALSGGSTTVAPIAGLENALGHFNGSLASEFLTLEEQASIRKAVATHEKLVADQVDVLAGNVTDVLKSKTIFAIQDVLNVIADSRDSRNREAIVDSALGKIFDVIKDLNVQASQATTVLERDTLHVKIAELSDIEKALSTAKAAIAENIPDFVKPADSVLGRFRTTVTTSNKPLLSVVFGAGLVVGGVFVAVLKKAAPTA